MRTLAHAFDLRSSVLAFSLAVLMAGLGFAPPALAGKVLYQQCLKTIGNPADGFIATLQDKGLFYSWSGYPAFDQRGKCANLVNATAFFSGEKAAGQNAISEAFSRQLPLNGFMNFDSIRNNVALDSNEDKTTFTNAGNKTPTKIGGAQTTEKGDPIVGFTNGGSSSIVVLSVEARENNTQDPLDPTIHFIPDGTLVSVMPTLDPDVGEPLVPGETIEFQFPLLLGANNWSFEYTYSFAGDLYTELIATDVVTSVPEPATFALLAAGLVAFLFSQTARRSFVSGNGYSI